MQINGPSPLSNLSSVKPGARTTGAQAPSPNRSIDTNDELTLSSEALSQLSSKGSDFRADKVAQLRAQIADGSYETPEKLDIALDRLLDQLG